MLEFYNMKLIMFTIVDSSVKPDLVFLRFEMIEKSAFATVVQTHNKYIALFLSQS